MKNKSLKILLLVATFTSIIIGFNFARSGGPDDPPPAVFNYTYTQNV